MARSRAPSAAAGGDGRVVAAPVVAPIPPTRTRTMVIETAQYGPRVRRTDADDRPPVSTKGRHLRSSSGRTQSPSPLGWPPSAPRGHHRRPCRTDLPSPAEILGGSNSVDRHMVWRIGTGRG